MDRAQEQESLEYPELMAEQHLYSSTPLQQSPVKLHMVSCLEHNLIQSMDKSFWEQTKSSTSSLDFSDDYHLTGEYDADNETTSELSYSLITPNNEYSSYYYSMDFIQQLEEKIQYLMELRAERQRLADLLEERLRLADMELATRKAMRRLNFLE